MTILYLMAALLNVWAVFLPDNEVWIFNVIMVLFSLAQAWRGSHE